MVYPFYTKTNMNNSLDPFADFDPFEFICNHCGEKHVFTEEEIRADLVPYFVIEKIVKSHRHRGPAAKRRSMSVYAQKN